MADVIGIINETFSKVLKNSKDYKKSLLESLEEIDQEEIVDDVDESIKSRRNIRIKEDIENTYEVTIYDNQNNIVDWFEEVNARDEAEAEDIALTWAWEDSDDAWEVNHMSKEEYEDTFGNKTIEDVTNDWKADKYTQVVAK